MNENVNLFCSYNILLCSPNILFSLYLYEVAHDDGGWPDVAVDLPGLGQVGDAGVGAHQHVHRVQAAANHR